MKRRIELFTAGCSLCADAETTVRRLAGAHDEVILRDLQDRDVAERAAALGIRAVPAVAVDGRLADCCRAGGLDEATLRRAGLGQPA